MVPTTEFRRVAGGLVTGLFTDHHVHLQLVDHTLLGGSRLGRVVDLGANPAWIAAVARRDSGDQHRAAPETPDPVGSGPGSPELRRTIVEYAGPFLTAAGGYPSDRAWAPDGSVREIRDAAHAAAVVAELAGAGACVVKIVANSDAGPVLDDDTFTAVVRAAAAHGLPVVAHAEGSGQAQRAARLGATRLAHTPFTERLDDDEIARQAASVEWVSTLAIHDGVERATAIENLRRFAAAGGTALYGSDMGNGQTPVDLREAEVAALREAGIDGLRLLTALAPLPPREGAPLLFLPEGDVALARPLTPADLEA